MPNHRYFRDSIRFQLYLSLKLGVFFNIINCICLSFVWVHADIYFNHISYFGLLIFCCQNVAISSYMFPNSILRYFE